MRVSRKRVGGTCDSTARVVSSLGAKWYPTRRRYTAANRQRRSQRSRDAGRGRGKGDAGEGRPGDAPRGTRHYFLLSRWMGSDLEGCGDEEMHGRDWATPPDGPPDEGRKPGGSEGGRRPTEVWQVCRLRCARTNGRKFGRLRLWMALDMDSTGYGSSRAHGYL